MELALPAGWTEETPAPGNETAAELAGLVGRHESRARGWGSTSPLDATVDLSGRGADVRRHRVLRDPDGVARAWGSVHDRAAGRVLVAVTVDPDLAGPTADAAAAGLFRWAGKEALRVAEERDRERTLLDSGAFADDTRQQEWLRAAGYRHVRDWWQMTRLVRPSEALPDSLPAPQHGVRVRRVRRGWDGLCEEEDLRTVHDVLETAFTDHFNSHREDFDEFVARLRTDPGHRWDHWWVAELVDGPEPVPAGALVASALPAGEDRRGVPQPAGSYVDYIGVLRRARGRGVAKALLHAVVADAAERGRNRVGLEVDADSPTGAADLYTSMGWETSYVTQSWHQEVAR